MSFGRNYDPGFFWGGRGLGGPLASAPRLQSQDKKQQENEAKKKAEEETARKVEIERIARQQLAIKNNAHWASLKYRNERMVAVYDSLEELMNCIDSDPVGVLTVPWILKGFTSAKAVSMHVESASPLGTKLGKWKEHVEGRETSPAASSEEPLPRLPDSYSPLPFRAPSTATLSQLPGLVGTGPFHDQPKRGERAEG